MIFDHDLKELTPELRNKRIETQVLQKQAQILLARASVMEAEVDLELLEQAKVAPQKTKRASRSPDS